MAGYFDQNYWQRAMEEKPAKGCDDIADFAKKGDILVAWTYEWAAWGRALGGGRISLMTPEGVREQTWREFFGGSLVELRLFGERGARIAFMVREDKRSAWRGRTMEEKKASEFPAALQGECPGADEYLTLDHTAWMWGHVDAGAVEGNWARIDVPQIASFRIPVASAPAEKKRAGLRFREFFRFSPDRHTLALEGAFPVEIVYV